MKGLKKFFSNIRGLNLRTPELLKEVSYATDLRNVEFSENFSISKRRGYQARLAGFGKCGSFTYNKLDIETGEQTTEKILIDDTLRRVIEHKVAFTYSGDKTANYQFALNPETQNFELKFFEDGTVVKTINLGTGKETKPLTAGELESAINTDGDSPFRMSTFDFKHAAFIETGNIKPINEPSICYDTEVIGAPINSPFRNLETIFETNLSPLGKKDENVSTMSTVQVHNVVYLTSKETGLWKYDGVKLVKAGLPIPSITSNRPAPAPADDKWVYIVELEYKDEQGNLVTSQRSNEVSIVANPNEPVYIDVNAKLTEDDSPVPIGAIPGFDALNIKMNLYRTVANGTTFYLLSSTKVASEGIQRLSATTKIADTVAATRTSYRIPFRDASPPPNCSYVDVWRNQLVMTGNPAAPQTVYLANTSDLEGFDFRNSFDTSSRLGGVNTSIKAFDNFLYVGRPTSISIVTGYPDDGTLSVDTMSDEGIGPVSNDSMVEANNMIYFVAKKGIYVLNRNQMQYISDTIQPAFSQLNFKQNQVHSYYLVDENKIMFLLPIFERTERVNKLQNYIIVYDISSNSFSVWNNLDYTKGISKDNDTIWFVSNENGKYYLNQFLNTNSPLDYADHNEAVSFMYKSHWDTAGDPSTLKKYLKIKLYSIDSAIQSFLTAAFGVDISIEHDFIEASTLGFTMKFGENAGWGDNPWGIAPWGDQIPRTKAARIRTTKAQSIRVILRNNVVHENVYISAFELEFSAPYQTKIRGVR